MRWSGIVWMNHSCFDKVQIKLSEGAFHRVRLKEFFKLTTTLLIEDTMEERRQLAARILQAGFFWPTLFKDAHQFVLKCDRCQRVGNISRRDEMPLNVLLEIEIFDVWGIDFMGPFISSWNNLYILLVVDHVSKWVEVKDLPTNTVAVVISFLQKNIFNRFGTPWVIISDEGSHFYNRKFTALMERFGVNHRVATAYHR